MAVPAPFCNVTVFTPPAGPLSPTGFRFLNANATLQDVISAFNNNFSANVQQDEFNRQLEHDLRGYSQPVNKGFRTVPSKKSQQQQKKPSKKQIPDEIKKEIGKLRFTEMSIVRQKIKVENPRDREQWVVDDRVKSLVLRDKRTGAQWTWHDESAGQGIRAGTEEKINNGNQTKTPKIPMRVPRR